MVEIQTNKMELTYSENIQQAAEAVVTWPEWKTQNIKAVFSEPDIKVVRRQLNLVGFPYRLVDFRHFLMPQASLILLVPLNILRHAMFKEMQRQLMSMQKYLKICAVLKFKIVTLIDLSQVVVITFQN